MRDGAGRRAARDERRGAAAAAPKTTTKTMRRINEQSNSGQRNNSKRHSDGGAELPTAHAPAPPSQLYGAKHVPNLGFTQVRAALVGLSALVLQVLGSDAGDTTLQDRRDTETSAANLRGNEGQNNMEGGGAGGGGERERGRKRKRRRKRGRKNRGKRS